MDSPEQCGFAGGIFHAGLPDGRIGATVEITPWDIVARPSSDAWETIGPAGTAVPRFSIPLAECRLDLGGESGRMVFCRNAAGDVTIFSEARGFIEALDRRSGGILGGQLESLASRRTTARRRFYAWLVLGTLAAAVLAVVGSLGVLSGVRLAIARLPVAVDERIGALAMQTVEQEGRLSSDHPASRFVTALVARLEPHASLPGIHFRVTVIDDPQVNAFALPGGQIVVYTGLLAEAGSSDQVAGVLAHEMAHATLRHGLEQVGRSMGVVAAMQLLVGDAGGLLAIGSQVAQKSILTSYGRGAETEADLEGARMLHEAGLDPLALAEFFATLRREQGDLPTAFAWLGSHPLHGQRIDRIEAFRKSLPPRNYASFDDGFAEAKRALAGGG